MLIYEKEGKLNLNFQTGNVPAEPNDIVISKENNEVKVMLGSTELKPAENLNPVEPEPSNPDQNEPLEEVVQQSAKRGRKPKVTE